MIETEKAFVSAMFDSGDFLHLNVRHKPQKNEYVGERLSLDEAKKLELMVACFIDQLLTTKLMETPNPQNERADR